jgi:hypothetical protein
LPSKILVGRRGGGGIALNKDGSKLGICSISEIE